MKIVSKDIAIRPRFQMELPFPKEKVLNTFDNQKANPFIVSRSDDHLFIKFQSDQSTFWSPQLHLEINDIDEFSCRAYGLYGPNPTLWTFFIFLHFGLATLFILLGIWAYSSASLGRPYGLKLGAMGLLVVLWIAFYAFGRLGRRRGNPQMHQLQRFMNKVLEQSLISDGNQTA